MNREKTQELIEAIHGYLITAREEREKEVSINPESKWEHSFLAGAAWAWDRAFDLVTRYAREGD